ncbi:MAG: YlbF family regulator [Bacilli bacterium]
MNNNNFTEKELQFIDNVRKSSLYKETIRLSDCISADQELNALSQERNDLYIKANKTDDEELRHQYEVEAKKLNDILISNPTVSQYLKNYSDIREILSYINSGILKEINDD